MSLKDCIKKLREKGYTVKKLFKRSERQKIDKKYRYPYILDGVQYYFLYPVRFNTRSHLNCIADYLNISHKNKYKVDLLDEILESIEIEGVSFEELIKSRYKNGLY